MTLREDQDPEAGSRRIAAALDALRRDLEHPASADPSGDAELRARLQDFADLFLADSTPGEAEAPAASRPAMG